MLMSRKLYFGKLVLWIPDQVGDDTGIYFPQLILPENLTVFSSSSMISPM